MLSQKNASIQRGTEHELERTRRDHEILILWLKGYDIDYICRAQGDIDRKVVTATIMRKRGELAEVQEGDIKDLIAERIAGLRLIKAQASDYLDYNPDKASQLLTVQLRAEETIAKIQGVLSEKVLHLGRIQHEIKMYNFEDKTPPMIVDMVKKPDIHLAEPELPELPGLVLMAEEALTVINELTPQLPKTVIAGQRPKAPVIRNGIVIMRPGDAE